MISIIIPEALMFDFIKKKNIVSFVPFAILFFVFVTSFILGFHNASLYNPSHGFDGDGHVYYIQYVASHKEIPPPNLGWETHQSPLYYVLGAVITNMTGDWQSAQYMNTFILWALIGMSAIGLWKIFKDRDEVILGVLSLAALPILNLFPAMVSNELLNTFFAVSTLVACIFLLEVKSYRQLIIYSTWLGVSFALGFWTKVSIIMITPVVAGIYLYLLFTKSKKVKKMPLIFITIATALFILGLSCPVLARAMTSNGPSNLIAIASSIGKASSPIEFYLRLDWIWKVDMYNTQYYSLLGGAWNSFWSDGHNAITPFIAFHKKAFVLWSLGFILFPISLYGLYKLILKKRKYGVLAAATGVLMFLVYIYYNIGGHYSAARLTYEMPIVLAYAIGIAAAAATNKRIKNILWILLIVQFIVMVSFYWILPWWHVTISTL